MSLLFVLLSLMPPQPESASQACSDRPLVQPYQARPGLEAKRRTKYRWTQVWQSAMRLVRVDKGWAIEDSSQEAGFLLFHDQKSNDYPAQGSIELIAQGEKDSGAGILVRAKVNNAGTHAAFLLLEALEKKLRADFGPPPRPERTKKKEKKKKAKKPEGSRESKAP